MNVWIAIYKKAFEGKDSFDFLAEKSFTENSKLLHAHNNNNNSKQSKGEIPLFSH